MKHLRVVVPDKTGVLAEVTDLLAARKVAILDFSVEAHGAAAVVRIGVEDVDAALEVMADAGYDAVSDQVLLARIEDKPGALAELSRDLAEAEINIRSLHHVRREGGHALVAISTDDDWRARKVLGEVIV